jgi:hypothetical protein
MVSLVGKALEEDDDFWGGAGAEFFGAEEGSEDKDFHSSDASMSGANDSFDSDFGRESEEAGSDPEAG